jgi:hypothetical protein
MYKSNPFIENLFIKESTKLTKISNSKLSITDSEGKEVEKNIVYAKEHNVDRTPFIKLFSTKFLPHLKKAGIIVFDYLCTIAIKYNTDYVILFPDDIVSRTGYKSKKSIYNGINELIDVNVIAKSDKPNIYWLNPSIIYKGERWYLQKK